MTTQFRTFLGDHKLFVIVLYKNILCFEGASSSCRVTNLKLPIDTVDKTEIIQVVHVFWDQLGSDKIEKISIRIRSDKMFT